jgi:adenosine/AMP kinase
MFLTDFIRIETFVPQPNVIITMNDSYRIMFTESNEVKLGVVITFSTNIDLSDYEAAKQKMEEAVSTWTESHIRASKENISIQATLSVHIFI